MIILKDDRINILKEDYTSTLFMCILYLLNQESGLKLNTAKIDIYYQQLRNSNAFAEDGELIIEKVFEFFNTNIAPIKYESPTYKLKKNEHSIVIYSDDSNEKIQCVFGVNNIVCYNPLGKTLKGKMSEAIVIRFK